MEKPENCGDGKLGNKYCRYCTDADGALKNREEIREGMIQYRIKSTGKSREEVGKEIDEYMKQMPAWRE